MLIQQTSILIDIIIFQVEAWPFPKRYSCQVQDHFNISPSLSIFTDLRALTLVEIHLFR